MQENVLSNAAQESKDLDKAATSLAIQYPFYDDLSGEESAQNSVQYFPLKLVPCWEH